MVARPQDEPSIATVWLREYAAAYMPSDCMFDFSEDELQRSGVSLLDIRNLFRNGVVVSEEKLDTSGAIWMVSGDDCDGLPLLATIHMFADSYTVKLCSVERQVADDGNSAA